MIMFLPMFGGGGTPNTWKAVWIVLNIFIVVAALIMQGYWALSDSPLTWWQYLFLDEWWLEFNGEYHIAFFPWIPLFLVNGLALYVAASEYVEKILDKNKP